MKTKSKLAVGIVFMLILLITGCDSNTELNNCNTGDYEAERDCYTSLAFRDIDPKICEKMPVDVNERQANKAFCLGFLASATGDLRICRGQKNQYYANYCEIIYERYLLSFDQEFEELKQRYKNE